MRRAVAPLPSVGGSPLSRARHDRRGGHFGVILFLFFNDAPYLFVDDRH